MSNVFETIIDDVRQVDKRVKSLQNSLDHKIAGVERQLEYVSKETNDIKSNVQTMRSEVNGLRSQLDAFQRTVGDFITRQMRANALNIAHHKKQELDALYEKKFSGYRKVRELAAGLLSTSDLATVQKSTFLKTSEKALLELNNYWLAYCMLAFSHWLNDNPREAYTALEHCIACDRNRTSLFFALVCRQAKKYSAFRNWAIYYIFNQTPSQLDENCIIFIDAYANGLLGTLQEDCIYKKLTVWRGQMSKQARKAAAETWFKHICSQYAQYSKIESGTTASLQTLKQNYTNFDTMASSLLYSRSSKHLLSFFQDLLKSSSDPGYFDRKLKNIQNHIISERNSQEKDLLKQMRRYDLIIANEGNEERAFSQLEREFAEKPKEVIDFNEMLYRALDNSLSIETTPAVKVLAVVLSQPLIAQAIRDIQEKYRTEANQVFHIKIENWSGSTYNGSNASTLCRNFQQLLTNKLNNDIEQLDKEYKSKIDGAETLKNTGIVGLVISLILFFVGFVSDTGGLTFLGVCGGIIALLVWSASNTSRKDYTSEWQNKKKTAEEQTAAKSAEGTKLLNKSCEQAALYRKEFTQSEEQARELLLFIDKITMNSTNLAIGQ